MLEWWNIFTSMIAVNFSGMSHQHIFPVIHIQRNFMNFSDISEVLFFDMKFLESQAFKQSENFIFVTSSYFYLACKFISWCNNIISKVTFQTFF